MRAYFTCLALCFNLSTIKANDDNGTFSSLENQLIELSQTSEWHNQLHFRNGRSEIDDVNFFLSNLGKTDPKSELLALFEAMLAEQPNDEDSVFCRYPSRTHWLYSKVSILQSRLEPPSCGALKQEMALLDAHSATLILASAHINSPASAFGHTFLRIDTAQQTPLTAYAINYAAQTNDVNGFVYAYKGIFGGYEGRYSILPYSKKIQEYGDMEQRDIWEYKLNLTSQEMERLILRILEIRNFYSDYYFLSENCSYNLLWLLQIARPSLNLIDEFNQIVIPLDTIRVIKKANLIVGEYYRPSSQAYMKTLAKKLSTKQSYVFLNSEQFDYTLIEDLPPKEQVATLELAALKLKSKRSKGAIDHETYTRDYISLLKARSQFREMLDVDVKKPTSPLNGHLSSRLSIGVMSSTPNDKVIFGIKPSYHNIDDVALGYLQGAYINFFNTEFSIQNNEAKLSSLKIIDIKSYAIQDTLFKPLSWQVDFGLDRRYDGKLSTYLKPGAGITLGSENYYVYMMAVPGVELNSDLTLSFELQAGLITQYEKIKSGLTAQAEVRDDNTKRQEISIFFTYGFNQSLAINTAYKTISYDFRDRESIVGINLFYYF